MITRWPNDKCPRWSAPQSLLRSRKIDSSKRETLNAGDQSLHEEVPIAVQWNVRAHPILFQMARLNDFYEFRKAGEQLAPPNRWTSTGMSHAELCPAGWPVSADSGPDRTALCAQFVCCRFTFWIRRLQCSCLINPNSSLHSSISIWTCFFCVWPMSVFILVGIRLRGVPTTRNASKESSIYNWKVTQNTQCDMMGKFGFSFILAWIIQRSSNTILNIVLFNHCTIG